MSGAWLMWRRHGRWLLLLVVLAGLAGLVGCASSDTENLSERPWNAPKSWENGLPTEMFEGR